MRVLLDQSFPLAGDEVTVHHVALHRFPGPAVTDEELLGAGAEGGFDAVCFLGEGHLAVRGLSRLGAQSGVVVAATTARNPINALQIVRDQAHKLTKFPPGALVRLLSDGPAELLAAE